MASRIQELLGKMKSAFDDGKERDQYKGTVARRWFIDNMGESSYKELLDKFDSEIHDNEWHGLWQDKWSKTIDRMVEARSVSFMDSGHRSVYEHYMDNECESMQRCRHYTTNFIHMEPELQTFFRRKNPDK